MTEKKVTVEQLLEKSKQPAKLAVAYHQFYQGKVQVTPKCAIRSSDDFAIWYTPGVAASCRRIKEHPEEVWTQTNRANYVAVVTDGTRVLGLGDIGPQAAMPVMEGKALLFKYLGGVDAFPICLNTKDPDEIVRACQLIEPTFGGINLEDLSKPKCFYVLDKTRQKLNIPVWHDDQQGTATVILAGLLNALKIAGKKPSEALITLIGVGSANTRTAYVLFRAGFKPGNLILVDSKGILHRSRPDLQNIKETNPWKYELAQKTNSESRIGDAAAAFEDADAVVAASKPGPGTIKKEWVGKMATNSIVFACA
ncbi:MAG: NADP-dependent malic enzyme, partial [Candidatus Bathyarchaeota archaeon]